MPVLDQAGESVTLPSSPFNRFGYDIEFSRRGHYGDYRIDFEAMARHLLALQAATGRQGLKIGRVIFDNALQHLLFHSSSGARLKAALPFSTRKPWVRHDEHYHVDFVVRCQPLG
ncbi:MAG: hypothetical protein ABWY06_00550 [Pseudomonas sp.]|uniref:hypothetical protein n=1 Tax=Pseudomonas sp. TaxID=306 RepID=UPI0033946986